MVGGDAVITEGAHSLGQSGVIRRNHSAFARRHVFHRVEAERIQIGKSSDAPAFVATANCMTGIINERHAMSIRDGLQCIVVARLSRVINGDDRLCARRNLLFDIGRIDQQRVGIDIGEHRGAALIQDTVRTGSEGHRRNHDLVSRTDGACVGGGM